MRRQSDQKWATRQPLSRGLNDGRGVGLKPIASGSTITRSCSRCKEHRSTLGGKGKPWVCYICVRNENADLQR